MLTRLEIANKVRAHLLKQGERASGGMRFACGYLDHKGRKCAIGCLIPEDHEAFKCLGGVEALFTHHPDLEIFQTEHLETQQERLIFLSRLQVIHDQRDPAEWPVEMGVVVDGEERRALRLSRFV